MVEAGGSGGGYELSVDLFRCDENNAILEEVSDLFVAGSIDLNVDRAVKLAASFTLRDPDRVTPYSDYLAPYVRIDYDDDRDGVYQQAGLFAITVPPGTYSPDGAVATFQGSDLTAVMASSVYTDTFSHPAAYAYRTAILGAISGSGLSRYNIPAVADTLPTAQSWKVGTSRLAKANSLLDQLGWYHLGMDLDGKISTPGPSRALASIEPWRTLTDSDLLRPVDVQPGTAPVYNVIVVVNDDATAAPLYAVARNDDPASPTSTVAIGREIAPPEPIKVTGSTTQAALDATAARYLAEARTYYRTAKLTLFHDPTALIAHQTVELDLTGEYAGLSGLWWVRTARLGLTPNAPLELEINQVTDDVNGVTV
jgi:hypothetical protein